MSASELSPSQITNPMFDQKSIVKLLGEKLVFDADEKDGDYRFNPDFKTKLTTQPTKNAAVLIGLVNRENGVNVVLTKRTEHLSSHSGQVAFPGGKIDPSDVDAKFAALREAHEEILVPPTQFDVIAQMPPYYSGSAFCIHPVLAFMDEKAIPKPNPDEVDYIFEVPLAFLMDQQNHTKTSKMWNEQKYYFLEMPYEGHYIWGVTAGIIFALFERVFK